MPHSVVGMGLARQRRGVCPLDLRCGVAALDKARAGAAVARAAA